MEVEKLRERLSGMSYHEWLKLKILVDEEFSIKISECKRQLTPGAVDQYTATCMKTGLMR